jgi:hypothetical protein
VRLPEPQRCTAPGHIKRIDALIAATFDAANATAVRIAVDGLLDGELLDADDPSYVDACCGAFIS